MIVYDLACEAGHRFEGWFRSSGDFATQSDTGLVVCPQCGSQSVAKAPMAPAVGRKANQKAAVRNKTEADRVQDDEKPRDIANGPMPPQVARAIEKLAEAQKKALENSTWVGTQFAEQSRAMHYGEREHRPIHGQASLEEAQDLLDEGVSVAPLPLPVAPPDDLN
ncbi:DUF1178 family protein [Aurantiacibacter spongiae]|uniref:DUF1178 family protein n=1 Tax=Aurantiacibacter spongiae TaxID=2488860 RepID=A0A3N5DI89_9SPHN|nr:DUF1178 family protein [Aurantiacibacter spongiae]RPF70345.1 DUF1178 family protein [Aurantiacibacter spongiae]